MMLFTAIRITWQDIKVNKLRIGWKGVKLKKEFPSIQYIKTVYRSAKSIAARRCIGDGMLVTVPKE
jgi:hypothetical protein